jgi:class II lanthipeptide synthase
VAAPQTKVPDSLRAQFYWGFLDRATASLPAVLDRHAVARAASDRIVSNLRSAIAVVLDEFLLAAIASEVTSARSGGELTSASSEERYTEVFLKGGSWTARATGIARRYALLFDQMATYAASMEEQLVRCIGDIAGTQDRRWAPAALEQIDLLAADRHARTGQPLLLQYNSGEEVVYKAGDHLYYDAVSRIVARFPVPSPYELRLPKAICHRSFCLVERIQEMPATTTNEVKRLYANFGALIAVMDAINYCDGHFENVVRCGSVPVIVDLETAFHVFIPSNEPSEERSVLYTGLVQVPPKESLDEGISAAVQLPDSYVQELGRPIAVNDRTDEIQLRYRSIRLLGDVHGEPRHAPVVDYVDDVVAGYLDTYASIATARDEILSYEADWARVASTRFRQVIRTTLYYVYLLRRMQMPEISTSADRALAWLRDGLSVDTVVSPYELYELRQGRIPIFYHRAGDRDLLDSLGAVYWNYLPTCSVAEVRDRIKRMDSAYADRQAAILKKNLSTQLVLGTAPEATGR